MADSLVLIASYAKSGNTWVRAVLQGLLTPEWAGNINFIDIGMYGSHRRNLFDQYAPVSAAELTPPEIDRMLPDVYMQYADSGPGPFFIKTHDPAHKTDRGEWLFPPAAVRTVIYLVRHPFDVAASFRNHMGSTMDKTIGVMGTNPLWFNSVERLCNGLQEIGSSWTEHGESWMQPDLPYNVLALRYEDLKRSSTAAFRLIAQAVGLPDDERLSHAVEAARFDRLKAAEQDSGFREKPPTSSGFFRVGGSMTWKDDLSEAQREQIIRDHGPMMDRLGYRHDGTTVDPADRDFFHLAELYGSEP